MADRSNATMAMAASAWNEPWRPPRVIFCRAILRNARLPYPTKLPRRPFTIEAVKGQ
jgi:hypothetical protein